MSYPFMDKQPRWAKSSRKQNISDNPRPAEIRPAPLPFKSQVWTRFGFYTLPGKAELDMTKAVSTDNENCNNWYNPIAILVESQYKLNRHPSKQNKSILSQPYMKGLILYFLYHMFLFTYVVISGWSQFKLTFGFTFFG